MSWNLKRKLFALALWVIALSPWCWVGSVFAREFMLGREIGDLDAQAEQLESNLELEDSEAPALSAEQQRLELMKWKLLPESDIAGTMHALESVARDTGIEIDSIRSPSSSEPGRKLFDVTGHGAPEQICRWLGEVENHERLIVVESGAFGPATPHGVGFELRLATFHEGGSR